MAMLALIFFPLLAFAAPNYIAERDPLHPPAGKQYRMWLLTPGRACDAWRSVKPVLPKEAMLLSESKRDQTGKQPGCKFLWVITPAAAPGDMKFELESFTGRKEAFESPVPAAASK